LFKKHSVKSPHDLVFKNYKETPLTPDEFYMCTGKKWPQNNAVYVKIVGWVKEGYYTKDEILKAEWYTLPYNEASSDEYPMACAISTKTPPKRWLPKEWKRISGWYD
jgi:hypothetical protein